MAITTTPYDPVYEPTACTAAPRLGDSRPIENIPVDKPLSAVLTEALNMVCETNAILFDICNSLGCANLLKNYSDALRSTENLAALVYNINDAATCSAGAAKLINKVLVGNN